MDSIAQNAGNDEITEAPQPRTTWFTMEEGAPRERVALSFGSTRSGSKRKLIYTVVLLMVIIWALGATVGWLLLYNQQGEVPGSSCNNTADIALTNFTSTGPSMELGTATLMEAAPTGDNLKTNSTPFWPSGWATLLPGENIAVVDIGDEGIPE